MAIEHLGREAAELLSLTSGGEARSLNRLAELAAWQVPACAGAHAAVWRDGELVAAAATHPDLAELAELQLTIGRGPIAAAADAGIQPGDIVLSADGTPLSSIGQLRKIVSSHKNAIALLVQHGNERIFVPVQLG